MTKITIKKNRSIGIKTSFEEFLITRFNRTATAMGLQIMLENDFRSHELWGEFGFEDSHDPAQNCDLTEKKLTSEKCYLHLKKITSC
ncbi:hypothetical protein WA026_007691 [Henosepilachna vigintioctopunctata]|uniref:Uncharacterized protein n=1 Tax=Henosepilachna vigintioctopunctata TaxID=420089 RepID=A0AAW1U7M5_9CUCU